MAEQSKVEQVARSLSLHASDGWSDATWTFYTGLARAAIEAMREPTKEMIGAREVPGVLEGSDTRLVWMAMIDAALAEGAVAGEKAGVAQAERAKRTSHI